jgi:hypothetical protein
MNSARIIQRCTHSSTSTGNVLKDKILPQVSNALPQVNKVVVEFNDSKLKFMQDNMYIIPIDIRYFTIGAIIGYIFIR